MLCAILKALHGFKEKKSAQGKIYAIFIIPSKRWKLDFQDFENCKKKRNSPEQLAELTQKEATETKTPHS